MFGQINEAIEALDFFYINTGIAIIEMLESQTMILLYIGMVANLLVIMLILISILLIYSLLLISIEKKTFEFGVMRMTGLS